MISLIVSIIALGAIITIHELGHFLAARACGVGVIEFSIGMGPRIVSKVVGNVRYSLRILPFGGSCMMLGEELDESEYADDADDSEAAYDGEADCAAHTQTQDAAEHLQADTADQYSGGADSKSNKRRGLNAAAFTNAAFDAANVTAEDDCFVVDGRRYRKDTQFVSMPAWKRFIIIFAGPAFNFILALLLSFVICAWYGFDRPTVVGVDEGMPAAEAGIEDGDEIYGLKAGGARMKVECSRDISVFMTVHAEELNAADTFTMYYKDASDGMRKKQAELTPVYDGDKGSCRLGFAYNAAYDSTNGIADTLACSVYNVKYCIRSSIESIRMIVHGQVTRQDVMGPVRMVAVMDESVEEAADYGAKSAVLTLIDLMILISGSLGCMNLLPLPALDGGRLVFIIIEMLIRKPVPKELEARVHMAGMVLLLGLMAFIMANDISMLIFKQ